MSIIYKGVEVGATLGGGGGGGSNMHTYSTTEQVVGQWIDGKPIYEITLETTSTSINVSSLNIDRLLYTNAIGSDTSPYGSIRWIVNSIGGHADRLMYLNGNTLIRAGSFYTFAIVLRYTKTTDSAST